ncbi:MAG: hypothetical protein Unbinned202contig1002_26 [Prokaryotic dsDNA virus sp.]|nr:MAG: hypothetical protein Unbinned202contig1002_26 [Prokaryotic dsDNA virus sp.]|tara:strand:+ start:12320 stop:12556 length:237 start_codon:yes stop_codon:yes gene_type:complete
MQWAIDAWCGYGNQNKKSVMKKPQADKAKKETYRMSYCISCKCVWETDKGSPQYIHKYQDFPTIGIKKKKCKYCKEFK